MLPTVDRLYTPWVTCLYAVGYTIYTVGNIMNTPWVPLYPRSNNVTHGVECYPRRIRGTHGVIYAVGNIVPCYPRWIPTA